MKTQAITSAKYSLRIYIAIILVGALLSTTIIMISSRRFEIAWKPVKENPDSIIKALPLACILILPNAFK